MCTATSFTVYDLFVTTHIHVGKSPDKQSQMSQQRSTQYLVYHTSQMEWVYPERIVWLSKNSLVDVILNIFLLVLNTSWRCWWLARSLNIWNIHRLTTINDNKCSTWSTRLFQMMTNNYQVLSSWSHVRQDECLSVSLVTRADYIINVLCHHKPIRFICSMCTGEWITLRQDWLKGSNTLTESCDPTLSVNIEESTSHQSSAFMQASISSVLLQLISSFLA